LSISLDLTIGAEQPIQVRVGCLRLQEADEAGAILDVDIGLTDLLGPRLRGDQEIPARLLGDLADQLEERFSER
jgi:hypothetical protein